jgi:hypothetical protein
MAITVVWYNGIEGVQVGGYEGFALFTSAVIVSWPSAWEVIEVI